MAPQDSVLGDNEVVLLLCRFPPLSVLHADLSPSALGPQRCSFSCSERAWPLLRGGVPYISEFTPVFLPVAFPHATSPPPAQARKVFIYLSVPMTPNFCLSLQLLSTTGFQSSSSATSTRSRTRTRYRTRAVSSQVDENLFGGIKVTLTEPPLGQLLRTNLALRKPPPKGLPDGRQREVPRTVLLNSDV